MYSTELLGLNTRKTDRDIEDGFLQESINLQRRDGAFRPIPERIISEINAAGYSKIILHKVSDENQINVLGFKISTAAGGGNLAMDLAGFLGGTATGTVELLTWFGTITDGVYAARSTVGSITNPLIPIFNSDNVSFTILNGIVYFMSYVADDVSRTYYTRLQYNEAEDLYETKNMYRWKTMIPFFPEQSDIPLTAPSNTYQAFSECGLILIRFAMVLKSGEVVLHSPTYMYTMFGLNRSSVAIVKDDLIENIHTFVNMDLDFGGYDGKGAFFDEEFSAINVYATTPFYETKFAEDVTGNFSDVGVIDQETLKGEFMKKAEEPFYLIKTINEPTTDKILLTVGQFAGDIVSTETYSKIDASTVAAGGVMPVDNFSYHSIYGKITSFNGRLIIDRPRTVLSSGNIRSLALDSIDSEVGFRIDTEDGSFEGISYTVEKALGFQSFFGAGWIKSRGLLSYPDSRATYTGGTSSGGTDLRLFKLRANALHNMACAFNPFFVYEIGFGVVPDGSDLKTTAYYSTIVQYYESTAEVVAPSVAPATISYVSDNRVQFSSPGEYSVWPAIYSYRIGEGSIVITGANMVNPTNADLVAVLVVGASDGLYTINSDPSGNNLVSSITLIENTPFISEEVLQIGNALLFVSDKGLMVFENGVVINLTNKFFPDQGNGEFPVQNTVFPNYNTLTDIYFGASGNPYVLDDIVTYMKGAIFAYDGRRKTIWCSNPDENFSLVYSLEFNTWGMSTLVFSEKIEFYDTLETDGASVYSRFLVKKTGVDNLLVLSGEDMDTEVFYHFMTRSVKMQNPNNYKKLKGLYSRCQLFRAVAATGYLVFGAWGKQDHNKNKKAIPITAKEDGRAVTYPGDVRQDIPTGWTKGKYKSVVVLQGGLTLPDSSIDGIDFDAVLVNEIRTR